MRVLALLFALTLAGKIQQSHSQEDEAESLRWSKVLQLPQLNKLAFRIIKDGFSSFNLDDLVISGIFPIIDFVTCFKKSYPTGKLTCSLIKNASECLEPFAKAGEELLPENAKYVVKIYLESNWKLLEFEYACKAKDEQISELSTDCIKKLPYDIFDDEYYQKHKEEPLKTFKATPTKANLCKAMRHFTSMYTDPAKETCKNDATVKALNGYIEASLKYYCD